MSRELLISRCNDLLLGVDSVLVDVDRALSSDKALLMGSPMVLTCTVGGVVSGGVVSDDAELSVINIDVPSDLRVKFLCFMKEMLISEKDNAIEDLKSKLSDD